jgi:two-component system OmpR family response regulator
VGIRLLLVEDDARLADVTSRALEAEGLIVDRATRGAQALAAFDEAAYDIVILDVGLPDTDGFTVCRTMRERGLWVPVLVLTARTAVPDRVSGLDAGADDYLAKPFALEELLARVRALARRGPVKHPPVLQVGDLRLSPATHQAWRGEADIDLSLREFALLEALMRHPGQVLSRATLLDQAWAAGVEQRSNVVEVCVRLLREKIDRPFGVRSIENVRGAGYRLRRDGGT